VWKPAVGRGIQLPEFPNALALPAAHHRQNSFGRDGMGQMIGNGPVADLGAVELEAVQAQGFGCGKAVGARRRTVQAFAEKFQNRLRPRRGVVTARVAGNPEGRCFLGAGAEVSCGEGVEAAAGDTQLISGPSGAQRALGKGFEHIANKRRRMTMDELLVVFRARRLPCWPAPAASLFVGHRYARPPQRLAAGATVVLLC
jgi:hypothetical protein